MCLLNSAWGQLRPLPPQLSLSRAWFTWHCVKCAACLITEWWGTGRPSVPLAGTRTYGYGRDTYVVELVIGSRVTWRDYSVGGERKKKQTFTYWAKGSEWLNRQKRFHTWRTEGTSCCGCWGPAAKALRRFAFKRIGISVTREQQQMPAYAHAPVHWESRNAWSWGS